MPMTQSFFTFQTLMSALPTPAVMVVLAMMVLTATTAPVLMATQEITVKQVKFKFVAKFVAY